MGLLGLVLPGWAKYAAIGIAVVAVFLFGWFKGNAHGTAKLERYVAAQAVASQKLAAARVEVTERMVTKYVKVRGETEVVYRDIVKEVDRYAETNRGNCLDPDWRRLHDAASLGQVPGAPGGADAAGGAPEAAAALKTVTENYAACRRNADRMTALQEWVAAQRAVK